MKNSVTKIVFALMASILAAPMANAELETLTCMPSTADGQGGILQLQAYFPGTYSDLASKPNLPMAGVAKQVVMGNEVIRSVNLIGTAIYTAKGAFYELKTDPATGILLPKITILIAAPASKSFSELKVGNKTYEMICE